MADAAVLQQLAPSGKLRSAVAVDEMGLKASIIAPAGMKG